jgi:hypothetical protein
MNAAFVRGLASALWAVCAFGCAVPAGRVMAAETAKAEDIADQVASAAWWGDYDELQRLYDAAKASRVRLPSGEYPSERFLQGYARIFNGAGSDTPNNDAFYAQIDKLTRQWASDHPTSAMAQNLYARALFAHAGFVRGGDYAAKVEPQAWAQFKKYLAQAANQLIQHADVVKGDTATTIYLIMIERAAGASFDVQWAIARDGLGREPDNWGIYDEMTQSALQKWGGTPDDLDTVARYAAASTPASDRAREMYARVYLSAAYSYKSSLFAETKANWAEMRLGLDQLIARNPSAENLNRYAFGACMAQDKAQTKVLLAKLGDQAIPEQWNGQRTLDVCSQWAKSE